MERVLNQDERIKRAEELYARRRLKLQERASATVNIEKEKKNKPTKKLIVQFLICIILYVVFYMAKNIPNIVSQDVMYKISDILEYDINFQELYNKYNSYIKKLDEKNSQEDLIEETLSVTEIISTEEKNEGIKQEEIEQEIIEESSGISQMEEDANFIKSNYSFIKPLEGEITSRYGIRNPTVATVPKYHTGIDIARVTGTVIVAAMEGTVELVSSQGDYGNHLKITNGEVSTLYAHCNKIYVSEGDYITQGKEIAEVGATGNVTGPHLHFEIRRNNQYVDPDLVLQF